MNILEKHPKEEEEMKRVAEDRERRHRLAKEKLKELLSYKNDIIGP